MFRSEQTYHQSSRSPRRTWALQTRQTGFSSQREPGSGAARKSSDHRSSGMVAVTARGSGRFVQPKHAGPKTLKSIISDRVEHCRVRLTVVRTPACYALNAAVTPLSASTSGCGGRGWAQLARATAPTGEGPRPARAFTGRVAYWGPNSLNASWPGRRDAGLEATFMLRRRLPWLSRPGTPAAVRERDAGGPGPTRPRAPGSRFAAPLP
jgi:hypothetical protein